MNSYRIVFPYVSDKTHVVSNKSQAFDACYEEINSTGKPISIFVVLDTDTNTPYYLENLKAPVHESPAESGLNSNDIDADSKMLHTPSGVAEVSVKQDFRDSSDSLQTVYTNPIHNVAGATSAAGSAGSTQSVSNGQNVQFDDPMADIRLNPHFQHLSSRVALLESELVRAKMKIEYATQAVGSNMRDMNQVQPKEEEEGCVIM